MVQKDQDKGLTSKQIHRKRLQAVLAAVLGSFLLFADPPLTSRPPRRADAQGLLSDQHPVQLAEIAVVEKSADHVRRDLLGAERVKLVPRREL
jgi:hypothetical protein